MIEIVMNNSSGLFQVDGLLKAKLIGSGLEPYVEVIAHIDTEPKNGSFRSTASKRSWLNWRREDPCGIV